VLTLHGSGSIGAGGAAIGCVGSIAAGRTIGRDTFGISSADPLTLGTPAAVLMPVAPIASLVPAWFQRRAAPTEPVRILES
jgi:hypothetical protein